MSWSTLQNDYVRVGPSLPCPICGKQDGCLVHKSGTYAVCYHVQSDKLWRIGFVHNLRGISNEVKKTLRVPYSGQTPPDRDWDTLQSVFASTITNNQVASLANNLGVSSESLHELCIGWSSTRKTYTFPVRNEKCQIVGIQTRMSGGQKRMIRGSTSGVFLTTTLLNQTQEKSNGGVYFLTEGVSDTAAAVSIGLRAVGRFNAVSCADILSVLLKGHTVFIIADNSGPEIRGAAELQYALKPVTKYVGLIVLPSGNPRIKDLRQCVQVHGDIITLNMILSQTGVKHYAASRGSECISVPDGTGTEEYAGFCRTD